MLAHSLRRAATALAMTCGLALAGAAQAQVANGDFSAGLAGWTAIGDAGAPAGTLMLTTAYTSGDDAPYNLSGHPAVDVSLITTAAGIGPYALDLTNSAGDAEVAYEGSLARQTLQVAAGQTLSFDWTFSSFETLYQDNAFVVIGGQVVTLATAPTAPSGVQSFSWTFSQAGTVLLGFGVVDTGDFDGVSTLGIDNVSLSPVPEPASGLALLLGTPMMLAVAHRRRRARAATR